MSVKGTLIKKLREKDVRGGILGLGYVGLPLAVVFGEAGCKVTGFDPDSRKVASLHRGVSYIPDVKTEAIGRLVKSGNLTATTDFSGFKPCDLVIEAVFEDLALKHRMVKDVEAVCGPKTIFASKSGGRGW